MVLWLKVKLIRSLTLAKQRFTYMMLELQAKSKVSRNFVKIPFVIFCAVIVVVVYTRNEFSLYNFTSSFSCLPGEPPSNIKIPVVADTKREPKIILLWTKYFSMDSYDGVTSLDPLGCEISDCIITNNRSLLNQSEALLFHALDTKLNDLPPTRKDSQRYVFAYFEPAGALDLQVYNTTPHFFNWTMTYRRDADNHNPYGHVMRRKVSADEDTSLMQTIRGKKKLIAWFVSNCNSKGKRDDYVKNLTQYVPVDVYGACGNLSCPKSSESSCNSMLRTDYKFYLAFENSYCRDYVTEKFFRTLQHDIVPIVYGGADYKKYAPRHSYIDTKDFNSPKELADYLKLLDSNDKLYQSYFDWKRDYDVDTGLKQGWCRLCANLHDPNLPRKTYENIGQWFSGPGECWEPFSPVPEMFGFQI